MKIAIGCDHAGYPLKVAVKDKLLKEGFEVVDFGTDSVESARELLKKNGIAI